MRFKNIKKFLILGGSLNSLQFCKFLMQKKENFILFINHRQANEKYFNKKLRVLLSDLKINFIITKNINRNSAFLKSDPKNSLIIGFGEPWKLEKKILKSFKNNSLDFMGIPLPTYRGGAHYTWMIINQNFRGGAFLQNIKNETLQGKSDSNQYLFGKYYKYPKKLKLPIDFFNYSCVKEIAILKLFYSKLKLKKNFFLKAFKREDSMLFPRLLSKKNSYINWSFSDKEIINFINAFDDPYDGAQTFLNKKRLYIKKIIKCKLAKINFGQFSRGLILNKHNGFVYIALSKLVIKTNKIFNEKKQNIVKEINIGHRLYTPQKYIDEGMIFIRKDI
jgi:methionyl-tRNA formyltransferase